MLQQTIQVLKERDTVRIPEDLAPLVADGYDDSKVPLEAFEKWMEHMIGEQVEAGQSRKYLIGTPDKVYSAMSDSSQLSALAALRYCLFAPMERLFSFEIKDEQDRHAFSKAAQTYLLSHLGRGFDSLNFYLSMRQVPRPSKERTI